jgi:hypothetical protein
MQAQLILDVAMELHLHLQLLNLHRSISQTVDIIER